MTYGHCSRYWGFGDVGATSRSNAREQGHRVLTPSREDVDLTDADATRSYIQSTTIDAVVHCAAYVAGIASSRASKHHSFDANVSMGMNLIRSCLENGITTLLNVGSATVYPSEAPQPLSESSLGQGALKVQSKAMRFRSTSFIELVRWQMSNTMYPTRPFFLAICSVLR